MPGRFKKFTRRVRAGVKTANRYRANFKRKHPYVYAAGKFALQNAIRAPRLVSNLARFLPPIGAVRLGLAGSRRR